MFFLVREPAHHVAGGSAIWRGPAFADLFKHRNVPLAMLTLMCAMGGVFVMGAMMPNYLTDYLHLSHPGHGLRHLRRSVSGAASASLPCPPSPISSAAS
jgi:hypothetical protein